MAQTTLSVRMDEDIKNQFDEFCANVGMNASVAVNVFVRVVLREKRIPFEIKSDNSFTNTTGNNNIPRLSSEEAAHWVDQLTGIIPPGRLDPNKSVKELITDILMEEYESLD